MNKFFAIILISLSLLFIVSYFGLENSVQAGDVYREIRPDLPHYQVPYGGSANPAQNTGQANTNNGGVGGSEGSGVSLENPIKAKSFEDLIVNIINFLWRIAIIATPLMIVVGGIIITTSAGNPEQVRTGKNTIIWALAGFALILMSRGLFNLIKGIIGAS